MNTYNVTYMAPASAELTDRINATNYEPHHGGVNFYRGYSPGSKDSILVGSYYNVIKVVLVDLQG